MFRYLSYKELVRVSNIAEMIELKPEQVVFSAGQPGDAMYVVLSGCVRQSPSILLASQKLWASSDSHSRGSFGR